MPLVQVRFKVCPTFTIWKIQPVCIVSDRWHLTSFQEQSVSKRLLVKLTKMACNCSNTNIVHEKKHVASYASVCQPTAIPRCSVYNLAISCFLMYGFRPCTKLTTRSLFCATPRFSRAICPVRLCIPHWTVWSQFINLTTGLYMYLQMDK